MSIIGARPRFSWPKLRKAIDFYKKERLVKLGLSEPLRPKEVIDRRKKQPPCLEIISQGVDGKQRNEAAPALARHYLVQFYEPGEVFWRGVGCNWLACLAVWLTLGSEDIVGKIFGIQFPVMAFVVLGIGTKDSRL